VKADGLMVLNCKDRQKKDYTIDSIWASNLF